MDTAERGSVWLSIHYRLCMSHLYKDTVLLQTVQLGTVQGCAKRDTIVQQERKRILSGVPVTIC